MHVYYVLAFECALEDLFCSNSSYMQWTRSDALVTRTHFTLFHREIISSLEQNEYYRYSNMTHSGRR